MLKAFFKIIRPINCLITFAAIIVGGLICSGDRFEISILMLAGVIGFIVTASGNAINDYFDIDIDKINRPERQLPSGTLTKKNVLILSIALNVFAIILSLIFDSKVMAIVFLTIMLLILYSYRLKRFLFIGNLVVSFLTAFTFIFAGVVVGNVHASFIPAAFAFLVNLSREIIKDMEDMEGDLKSGVMSLPIKFGIDVAKYFVLIATMILFLFTFVPFLFRIYKIEYFLIVMIIVNPILFYSIKTLFENSSKKNLQKISFILKISMIFGLIAIYAGK